MKRSLLSFLLFIGVVAYSQDKEIRINLRPWSKNKINSQVIENTVLVSELYKAPSERTYEQKAKTSLIIGLSLLPPTFLFIKLAEPKYPDRYKIGWGAAAFVAGSTAVFYLIRHAVFKKKVNKTAG